MTHDFTWHILARARRRVRLATPLALLLACTLLAGLPALASATTPDVRGEWALTVSSEKGTLHGIALITQEANVSGEFAALTVSWEKFVSGTFTGKLEGATATVKTTSAAFPPALPEGEFNSTEMKVEEGVGTLALSGSGKLNLGTEKNIAATETLTRIKTQKQIEEQEAREQREREEALARQAVRGEWALTFESPGAPPLKGIALISEAADASNAFSGGALFEGVMPGSFAGKLEGAKATVTVTIEPNPFLAEGAKFTSATGAIAVSSASNPASMTGPGVFKAGQAEFPSMLTATRVKTYQEVVAHEKAVREEKEKQEKEAREAKEKAEREAREKVEVEAKKKREAEEAAKAVKPLPLPLPLPAPALTPVTLASMLTASHSGLLSLNLTNPNAYLVNGHLKLTLAKAGKAAGTKHKTGGSTGTLGEASFTIGAHSSAVVKLKLSKSGRAQLTRHKTLRVLVTITTQAVGQANMTKSYTLTLHSPATGHHGKGYREREPLPRHGAARWGAGRSDRGVPRGQRPGAHLPPVFAIDCCHAPNPHLLPHHRHRPLDRVLQRARLRGGRAHPDRR